MHVIAKVSLQDLISIAEGFAGMTEQEGPLRHRIGQGLLKFPNHG